MSDTIVSMFKTIADNTTNSTLVEMGYKSGDNFVFFNSFSFVGNKFTTEEKKNMSDAITLTIKDIQEKWDRNDKNATFCCKVGDQVKTGALIKDWIDDNFTGAYNDFINWTIDDILFYRTEMESFGCETEEEFKMITDENWVQNNINKILDEYGIKYYSEIGNTDVDGEEPEGCNVFYKRYADGYKCGEDDYEDYSTKLVFTHKLTEEQIRECYDKICDVCRYHNFWEKVVLGSYIEEKLHDSDYKYIENFMRKIYVEDTDLHISILRENAIVYGDITIYWGIDIDTYFIEIYRGFGRCLEKISFSGLDEGKAIMLKSLIWLTESYDKISDKERDYFVNIIQSVNKVKL